MKASLFSRRRLKIVFYNGIFGSKPDLTHVEAEPDVTFSSGRSHYFGADAVIFHVPDLCARRLRSAEFRFLYKPKGQLWIAWSMESALNYPTLEDPGFLRRIDAVVSYRRDADIWASYCPPEAEWHRLRGQPLPEKTESAPMVMFQSALANNSRRFEYTLSTMSRIRVDSYGRILNNRETVEIGPRRATKLATISRYKFCLCLENALDTDYVTEKFYDPLLAGTVPVYRGAPNVDHYAPGEQAFINADDFSGPEQLCAYLHELDRNPEAYQRFFRWREQPYRPSFEADLKTLRRDPLARLVDLVRHRKATLRQASGPN